MLRDGCMNALPWGQGGDSSEEVMDVGLCIQGHILSCASSLEEGS